MLPPGIFLWESGFGDTVAPCSPSSIAQYHPGWKADIAAFGPWHDSLEVPGCGRFLKASRQVDTTIVIAGQCSTTMEATRVLAEAGVLNEWGSVVSVVQSGGRGQLRRPWVSSPGNLHVSMILPDTPKDGVWASALGDLRPLVAGYILSEAIQEQGGDIRLKWPNDLLQNDRKVGGLLIEERNGLVVLGVGLNLADSPSDAMMREDHSVSAGVLQILQQSSSVLGLWETLVNRGKNVYIGLLDDWTPTQLVSVLVGRLAWLGQRVLVQEAGEESYFADITGLSPKGGLVLRRGARDVVLYSGSIFPR